MIKSIALGKDAISYNKYSLKNFKLQSVLYKKEYLL